MDKTEIIQLLRRHFLVLAHSTDALDDIAGQAQWLRLPAGKVLMQVGDTIEYIPFVVSGSIKVVRSDAGASEILLYYIEPGESCALTLSSTLRREKSRVKALVHQACEVVLLPASAGWQLVRKHPVWFEFVLDAYSQRLDELVDLVEELGFRHLDERLEKYLRETFQREGILYLHRSHQEIADDLGTARVVVSRMLKNLERRGLIQLMRGRIKNVGFV